jgi:hypothetical protein
MALVAVKSPPTADPAAGMFHTGLVGMVVTILMHQLAAGEVLTTTNLGRLDSKDLWVVWLR